MFETLFTWLDSMGAETDAPLAYTVLFFSAMVEYVFPPFPGDMVTVFGGILVSAYSWSLVPVFCTSLLGSLLGGLLAFWTGQKFKQKGHAVNSPPDNKLARMLKHFHRYGTLYLLFNRFLPGVRPLIFVAAGLADTKASKVLLLSAISTFVWTTLLMYAGSKVGRNLKTVETWLKNYTTIIVIAALLLGIIYLLVRLQKKTKR